MRKPCTHEAPRRLQAAVPMARARARQGEAGAHAAAPRSRRPAPRGPALGLAPSSCYRVTTLPYPMARPPLGRPRAGGAAADRGRPPVRAGGWQLGGRQRGRCAQAGRQQDALRARAPPALLRGGAPGGRLRPVEPQPCADHLSTRPESPTACLGLRARACGDCSAPCAGWPAPVMVLHMAPRTGAGSVTPSRPGNGEPFR
jgi:hypothetical protein